MRALLTDGLDDATIETMTEALLTMKSTSDPRSASDPPLTRQSKPKRGRLRNVASRHRRSAPRGSPKLRSRSRRINRALLRPLLMVGGILVVAVGSGAYWLTGGRYVSIDDAMCAPRRRRIATDVSGIVASVPVHEGQRVKKGDVLLRLDPRQFQIAVNGAKANLGRIASDVDAMKVDYRRMLREVEVKQAQVQADQAKFDRFANLVKSGGITRSDYDNARFKLAADQQSVPGTEDDSRRAACQA